MSSLLLFQSLVALHILTGAVRLIMERALTPALWSVPLFVLTLIVHHQRRLLRGCARVA